MQHEHLTFRMHYNKTTHAFSIRRSSDRSVVWWLSPKVPLMGTVHTLAPNVHILATRKDYMNAQAGSRPVLTVAVTQFPRLRLFTMSLKEAL